MDYHYNHRRHSYYKNYSNQQYQDDDRPLTSNHYYYHCRPPSQHSFSKRRNDNRPLSYYQEELQPSYGDYNSNNYQRSMSSFYNNKQLPQPDAEEPYFMTSPDRQYKEEMIYAPETTKKKQQNRRNSNKQKYDDEEKTSFDYTAEEQDNEICVNNNNNALSPTEVIIITEEEEDAVTQFNTMINSESNNATNATLLTAVAVNDDHHCLDDHSSTSSNNSSTITLNNTEKKKKQRWLKNIIAFVFNKNKVTTLIRKRDSAPSIQVIAATNNELLGDVLDSKQQKEIITQLQLPPPTHSIQMSPEKTEITNLDRIWVFRLIENEENEQQIAWIGFDYENQERIEYHVKGLENGIPEDGRLAIFDSHIRHKQMPVVITPYHQKGYYFTDVNQTQLITLEVTFIENHYQKVTFVYRV